MSWQNEVLLERLRAKCSHIRPLADLARCARAQLLDRAQLISSREREQLVSSLKLLQRRVGVCSQQSCMDRIQTLSETRALRFSHSGGSHCSVEAEWFRLRVRFDPATQTVIGVQVQHQADGASVECAPLSDALAAGDFVEFDAHLRGLLDVYDVEVGAAVKPRLHTLISVCEQDVERLALWGDTSTPVEQAVDCGLGFVRGRQGGRSMRLTFLVPPRHLIDTTSGKLLPLKAETLSLGASRLGYWAEVFLTSTLSVQTLPCASVLAAKSSDTAPVFVPLSSVTALSIPATLTLKLGRPLPCDQSTCRLLERLTGHQLQLSGDAALGVWQLLAGGRHELCVRLPGQQHRYFVDPSSSITAVNVVSVPFTHVAQLRQIVTRLRRQALLHALLSSVVRDGTGTGAGGTECDGGPAVSCELSVPSCVCINMTVCHPHIDSLCRVRVQLRGGSVATLQCSLADGDQAGWKNDDGLTRVLRVTLSLPVTVRALLTRLERKCQVKLSESHSAAGRVSPQVCLTDGITIKREPMDHLDNTNDMCLDGSSGFSSSAAALAMGCARERIAGGGGDSESGMDTSPCDELRNIESTVRQIELDKAQGGVRVAQSLARDILGLSGSCAPNIPSSLTITPIPPTDKLAKSERRDRERGEKRRRGEVSPSSRSPRDSDDLLSPSRSSSAKLSSKHTVGTKHSTKSSLDSPPFKRHTALSNPPSSLALSAASSTAPSSKVSSKFSTASSKHMSSSSPVASSVMVESGGDHNTDSLRDQIKSLIAKGELNDLACASQSLDSPRDAGDLIDSRRGYLSDVITKLNSIVAEEGSGGVIRDERKSEFIVKPSGTDGIKLTINKTKSRSSSSSPIGSRHTNDPDRCSPSPAVKTAFSPVPAVSRKALYRQEDAMPDGRSMLAQETVCGRGVIPATAGAGRSLDKRDLALDRELPPLPKSLEIKKIGRSVESAVSQSGGGRWQGIVSSTGHERSPTHTGGLGPRVGTALSSMQMHMMSSSAPDARRLQSGPQSASCLIDTDIGDDPLMALGK